MKRKADSGVLDGAAVRQTRSSKAAVFGNSIVLVMALGAGCAWWWLAQHKSAPPRARVQPPAALVENPPVASPMTNETVVQMAEANVTPSVIINRIRSSKTNFDVSPAAVIGLTKSGVPDEVIEVMGDPLGAGTAPVSPATAKPPATVTLEDGLPIHLALAEDIPNNAMQGDAVRFTVAEAVRVDGAVVIPRGALAVGSIVDGAKKKVFGIGGKMTLRLDKVTAVGGQSVPIRATPERNRDGSSKRPVDTGSRKPKDVAAAAGARYAGYVEGPKTVPVKK